jgi:hypothetical protein
MTAARIRLAGLVFLALPLAALRPCWANAEGLAPGAPAPPIEGVGLDGQRHALADLTARKKLIYFFRPFKNCVDELQVLAKIKQMAGDELQVLAVDPYPADRQRLKEETRLANLPFAVVLGGEGQVKSYGLTAGPFPPALFVVADSAVAGVRFGFIPEITEFLSASSVPLYGGVEVVTDPAGCKVSLDGTPTEKTTPLRLEKVAAGSREISLLKDGYEPKKVKVTVAIGGTAEVRETLQPTRTAPPTGETATCVWRGTVPPPAGGMVTSLLRPRHGRRIAEAAEREVRVDMVRVGNCKRVPGVPVRAQFALREGGVFEFPASTAGNTVQITFECRLARAALLLSGDVTYYDPGGKELASAVAAEFTANKYLEMLVGDPVQAALEQERLRPTAGLLSENRVKGVVTRLAVEELVRLICVRRGSDLELKAEIYGAQSCLWATADGSDAQAVRVPFRALTGPAEMGTLRGTVRRLLEPWFSS